MSKEDCIEVMGKVVEKFRAGMFTVELDAAASEDSNFTVLFDTGTTIRTDPRSTTTSFKPNSKRKSNRKECGVRSHQL